MALWTAAYVACLEGGTVTGVVDRIVACLDERPSGPYVWYDEETGAVVIDFERIRNDWLAELNCN